jgi:putative DNA primase/helicase
MGRPEMKKVTIPEEKRALVIDATHLFRDALQSEYGVLDWLPVPDGTIHRFHVPGDKPGTFSGWYVLYLDGIASGAFGSWKAGSASTWSSREPAGVREAMQIRERIDKARRQREVEQQRRQQQAADLADRWWRDACRADPSHTYLIAKGVWPHGLRQRRDELLVLLYADGHLVNLQRIAPDGSKRFLFGGRIKGCYSPLGQVAADRPLCICEGWATAATLHQDGGYTVAAAMNAGNLKPTALAMRARYPYMEIIIAGDDDRMTDGNPGRTAANAAVVAGCLVTFPEWPADAPADLSDYNDLVTWRRAHGYA